MPCSIVFQGKPEAQWHQNNLFPLERNVFLYTLLWWSVLAFVTEWKAYIHPDTSQPVALRALAKASVSLDLVIAMPNCPWSDEHTPVPQ